MGGEHQYWEWREELLKHPDGRALGGEACVKCGESVPSNAHWKHRDRHVCSERCNHNLARQFNARLRRGDELPIPAPVPMADPRTDASPRLFGMLDSSPSGEIRFEYEGFGPRAGDTVERFGVITRYSWYRAEELPSHIEFAPHGLFAAEHESGHVFASVATETGTSTRMMYGDLGPDGERRPFRAPFDFNGQLLVWMHEFVSDVTDDGSEYTWEATICVPVGSAHPGGIWSPAYSERSARRKRITSSTGRHARRVRVEAATTERFDPMEVFVRDDWTCQLCLAPVDAELKWPDPVSASLDHVKPLAAGGEHSRANTQLAHWICNVRKGATWSAVADLDNHV